MTHPLLNTSHFPTMANCFHNLSRLKCDFVHSQEIFLHLGAKTQTFISTVKQKLVHYCQFNKTVELQSIDAAV